MTELELIKLRADCLHLAADLAEPDCAAEQIVDDAARFLAFLLNDQKSE